MISAFDGDLPPCWSLLVICVMWELRPFLSREDKSVPFLRAHLSSHSYVILDFYYIKYLPGHRKYK